MTKSILIKAEIEGSGIINFDSNEQKYLWNRQPGVELCRTNNVNFGKGRYYGTGKILTKTNKETKEEYDVELLHKVAVISADCIRHAMWEDTMPIHMPNIMHDDNILLSTVSTPSFVQRGYMFARTGKSSWKRKSPFTLSYAKQVSSSVPMLETFANSQAKNVEKDEDKAETSFFKREVRGDTKYSLTGAIDLRELGFISVSDVHDRISFDPDYANTYREKLGSRLGSKVNPIGYYQKDGEAYGIPEYGILLTDEQVKFLALDLLKRLARFSINRTVTGNAQTVSLKIKLVDDALTDLAGDDEGWVTVFENGKFNVTILDKVKLERGYTLRDLQELAAQEVKGYKEKYGYTEAKAAKKAEEDAAPDSEEPKKKRAKK